MSVASLIEPRRSAEDLFGRCDPARESVEEVVAVPGYERRRECRVLASSQQDLGVTERQTLVSMRYGP